MKEIEKEIEEVKTLYKNTDQWLKAPNGKPTNLPEKLWLLVRTPSFKKLFGDWESAIKIIEAENNLHKFLEILEKAEKESREEIFAKYDNVLTPIAYIPLKNIYFTGKVKDNRLYTGLAYFIDHAVNSHPEVKYTAYNSIQDILANPDEIIIDKRKDPRTKEEKDNLLFVKKYDKNLILVSQLETNNNGQILLHKSFYYSKKNTPYPSLSRVRGFMPGGGRSPIGRAEQTTPGGILSALDNYIIADIAEEVKENISKIVDENGEPLLEKIEEIIRGF